MKRANTRTRELLVAAALVFWLLPAWGARAENTPSAAANPPAAGVVLEAKILHSLSTKNAKPGDAITARTLKSYKLPDGTELPKGSVISGKLAFVRSKKKGDGKAIMTFRFDEFEAKDGKTIPIHGLVVAIGPSLAPDNLFGANNVMNRNATGMSNVLDPNTGLGSVGAKDEDDIPLGSRLQGVALGKHMDADWTTALEGFKTDIDLDSSVLVKVQLM